jgi:predicted metal-dependent HD superfamily phosphohydrolase
VNGDLRQLWNELLRAWRVDSRLAEHSFVEIAQAYWGPGRYYHNLDHVREMLATVEGLSSHARNPDAVQLATWLHDVVYDSKASDNEERSARYAERLCSELSIPEGPLVAALILKTKMHQAAGEVDAQVLLDADLAILGASEAEYQSYAERIRHEYALVPEREYRQVRRRLLGGFLIRPNIYHFLTEREEPARRNIAGEIARLSLE